jgi:Acyl-coenzyme A synthetases/AMP-(fatty) acid ligases
VRSEDRGYFRITGRIDDVLNVSGHRMGTMEIESALVAKTDLGGRSCRGGPSRRSDRRSICAFVVLKRPLPTGEEAKQIANELRNWVAKEIGPIAKPKDIRFGENLPKTRSGKIMRRLLRSIAKGEAITQDTTTLENPAILDQLAQNPLIMRNGAVTALAQSPPPTFSRCLRPGPSAVEFQTPHRVA